MTGVEGNASVYHLNPVSRITGEGRAEYMYNICLHFVHVYQVCKYIVYLDYSFCFFGVMHNIYATVSLIEVHIHCYRYQFVGGV